MSCFSDPSTSTEKMQAGILPHSAAVPCGEKGEIVVQHGCLVLRAHRPCALSWSRPGCCYPPGNPVGVLGVLGFAPTGLADVSAED
jgi:hypothetical protein